MHFLCTPNHNGFMSVSLSPLHQPGKQNATQQSLKFKRSHAQNKKIHHFMCELLTSCQQGFLLAFPKLEGYERSEESECLKTEVRLYCEREVCISEPLCKLVASRSEEIHLMYSFPINKHKELCREALRWVFLLISILNKCKVPLQENASAREGKNLHYNSN